MAGELLFDTNAVSAWNERDRSIFAAVGPYAVAVLSVITVGEMEYGAARSAHVIANRETIQRTLATFRLLFLDSKTARMYGEIHSALRRKGRPIPRNDIWIAALAIQHDLPLLTRDRHFENVDGLQIKNW